MSTDRILLVEGLDAEAEARLAAASTLIRTPTAEESVVAELVRDCDALIVRTHHAVTRRVLAAGQRLRVVGVAGVGTDRVDLAAAEELGVAIVSAPAAATDAVADLSLALMLQLLRPIPRLAGEYRRGQFAAARANPHGRELCELTVGIVGMGRIGSRVGRTCAAGFGARVLYNDIVPVGPFDFRAQPVEKSALWSESDIITLHVPLTEPTRGLISAAVLSHVRPTALLINTARGGVVDTPELTSALASGRLAGAALDVTDPEPLPADHPLFACERCILTPHIAARTVGGLRRMCAVADQVVAYLAASTPR